MAFLLAMAFPLVVRGPVLTFAGAASMVRSSTRPWDLCLLIVVL